MTECRHANLFVVADNEDRLRCRHCHLTLKADEIRDGYCPECFEVTGRRRNEFEKIESGKKKIRYRCEDCGAQLPATDV